MAPSVKAEKQFEVFSLGHSVNTHDCMTAPISSWNFKSGQQAISTAAQDISLRNTLRYLHAGAYRGVALLYSLAGLVLCLCAVRSLLRRRETGRWLHHLWSIVPQLLLGGALVLMCLLDRRVGHPEDVVYWYDDLLGRDLWSASAARREPSTVIAIAASGWFSAIVLAFYGTAVLSVAITSVRLYHVHLAEFQKYLERRHSGGGANHVKAV